MAVVVKDMNWRDCEKMHAYQFFTETEHVIRIVKHSIPIVFIPGIMGSRLINYDGKAWDPDSKTFMIANYIATGAATHKKYLIDSPHTVIHHGPPPPPANVKQTPAQQQKSAEAATKNAASDKADLKARFASKLKGILTPQNENWQWLPIPANVQGEARAQQAAQVLVDNGWGEVALGFYEKVLFALGGSSFNHLERCFVFPIYARGYNWVNSNDDSGAYLSNEIQNIIKAEKKIPGRECDRVIVVTHSMGGLASRSAMKLHGLEGSCFGALHGAQPATGAPEAYREMRGGSQGGASAYVIGHTSALVMPVLANCAGGLELLPNRRYVTNDSKPQWLQQKGKDGKLIGQALPAAGDPYNEIYKADSGFLRLILHPELLDPGGTQREEPSIKKGQAETPLAKAKALMDAADAFHKKLGVLHHAKTAVAYGASGPPTYDKILYAWERDYQKKEVTNKAGDVMAYQPDSNPLEGEGADLDGNAWYLIAGQDGAGDGTVPRSSGSSLPPTLGHAHPTNGPVHSQFYDDDGVLGFTNAVISYLAEEYRATQVAAPKPQKKPGPHPSKT